MGALAKPPPVRIPPTRVNPQGVDIGDDLKMQKDRQTRAALAARGQRSRSQPQGQAQIAGKALLGE